MDMDFREPTRTQSQQHYASEPQHEPIKNRSGKGKKLLMWLVVLLLIAGAAGGGWYYRDRQAKDDTKLKQTEIDSLKTANASLAKDLKEAQGKAESAAKPSQQDLDNIAAAVKSGNYAALEQLMASKVTVIIAASEGLGERTPAQAIADIKYLDSGTDPWDFALPAATVDGYQAGDYKQYFPDGALAGQSANNYVVSFSFDSSGKVSTIFMVANADLL